MKTATIIFALIILASVIVTWPLVAHLSSFIIDSHDGLLITWIINWNIHAQSLNTNIFYPYTNTLAFSDYHLLESLVALPFVKIFGEPLLAFNINFILGFVITAFAIYTLVFHLTKKISAAFFAGILFTFSTIHLNYMTHLQLFDFWPVIFTIYFVIRQKFKSFLLFFWLSSLNSPLNFYFLLTICLILRKFKSTFFATIITAPFLLPYFFVSRQFGYVRPINDAIHFSLQFPDLLNISSMSRLSNFIPPTSELTPAYFGGVFLVLFIAMIWGVRNKIPNNKYLKFFLSLALVSFILSLGPALHISPNTVHIGSVPAIPLPYAIFYYLLPGFSGFRTPSRWIVLTALSLSVAIGIYFTKRLNWKTVVILSILILAEINFPFRYSVVPSVKEFPLEQIWLKDNYVGAPIIQFPIYNWDDRPQFGEETLREYYSTIHWHPMFNGFSGFSPKEWENRVKWLQKEFPSIETINYLKTLGIKLVLAPVSWDLSLYSKELKLVINLSKVNIYEVK